MNKVTKKVEVSKVKKDQAVAQTKVAPACGCGCGGFTKGGRFLPGHDAKFHSAQMRGELAKKGSKAKPKQQEKAPAAKKTAPVLNQEKAPVPNVRPQPRAESKTHYDDKAMEADRVQGLNDGLRGVVNSQSAKTSRSAYLNGNSDGMTTFRAKASEVKEAKKQESLTKLQNYKAKLPVAKDEDPQA